MSIWLEDRIRIAILDLRWTRAGDGPHPDYFVDAPPESLQLKCSVAYYLAHFITARVIDDTGERQNDSTNEELDKYSPEVIASYLEDLGYTVISPD